MSLTDIHRFEITRVDESHPNRCQAVISSRGQCWLKAVEGSKYCPCHGGNQSARDKNNLFRYRLASHQTRLDEFSDSTSIKSLRDEIAILRFLVQKRLELVGNDLLLHSGVLSRLILQINSLAVSCAKVEHSLDAVMEKNDLLLLSHNVIMAARKFAPDPTVIDKLIEDVTAMMDRLHRVESGTAPSNYKLAKWGDELSSYLSQERVVSVRGEIGVLRLLIEEKLNKCKDASDLLFETNSISTLVTDVEKLVTSCHRLEVSMGLLVDKDVALEFGQELILVVGNHISDSHALVEIADALL